MNKRLIPKDLISLRDSFHKFEECFKEIKIEYDSFCEKGNQSAAKRARKKLVDISKLSKEIRLIIQKAKINSVENQPKRLNKFLILKEMKKKSTERAIEKLNPKLVDLVGFNDK